MRDEKKPQADWRGGEDSSSSRNRFLEGKRRALHSRKLRSDAVLEPASRLRATRCLNHRRACVPLAAKDAPEASLALPYVLFGWCFRRLALSACRAGGTRSACTACTACATCGTRGTGGTGGTGCACRSGGAGLGDNGLFAGGEAKRHHECGCQDCVFHGSPLSEWVRTRGAKVGTDARLTTPCKLNCRTGAPPAVRLKQQCGLSAPYCLESWRGVDKPDRLALADEGRHAFAKVIAAVAAADQILVGRQVLAD